MNAAARRYHAVATQTASGERLMILLMHAALSSMQKARAQIEKAPGAVDDADEVKALVTKALDIVQHLQSTLDVTRAPAVTKPIVDCYAFVVWKLVAGRNQRSAELLAQAAQVFGPIVDAFDHAVEAAAVR